uniref:DUF5658 domain-containing protein n=1 Tax=Candidatus Methanogaster sp. ANME-2c ERB4 TaxID=2759911 RepID=A0A7G9YG56_9EURY|nr:hypothetical protein JMDIOONB_00002 [Methanosarcinales archaeon ANME-2c ERB4]
MPPSTQPTRIPLHHLKTLLSASPVNSYLFIFTIIFSLYDTISTAFCVNANGHEYELSTLLKWAIHNFGVAGLLGLKMGVTLVALAAVYWIIANGIHLGKNGVKKFYGVYLGVILSNAYAGTSNISVLLGNGSFCLLGLNAAQIALLLAFLPLSAALFFDKS